MKVIQTDYQDFFKAIKLLKWNILDEKEAKEFGCNDVYHCFQYSDHFLAQYYLVKDEDNIYAAYIIQRDGSIILFTSIQNHRRNTPDYFYVMKEELDKQLKYHHSLFVKVANWFLKAKKFVELLGFKPAIVRDNATIYLKMEDWQYGK